MAFYSIKEVEHLSGVKAHTLRVWEQRYKIITPKRTETNIRFYTDTDLKQILNIALLNKYGHRIGNISKMSTSDIEQEVNSLEDSDLKFELQITRLTNAMIEMEEEEFEKIVSTAILQNSFEDAMRLLIYPFLERIGIMWLTNHINPAQEHFISNLIRQKIIVAIDGQVVKKDSDSRHFLLYLPEKELHEIGLLFLCYLLKARNHRVTYLGANVPFDDVIGTVVLKKPEYIYSIFTSLPSRNQLQDYLDKLSQALTPHNTMIVLSGGQVLSDKLNIPHNIHILRNMKEIFAFIDHEIV